MVFRIKDSPVYRIEPTVPGVGRLPRMTTGTRDKKLAEQMEAALPLLATSGYRDLVEQLRDGHVTLKEVWNAHTKRGAERAEALESLMTRKGDPLLSVLVPERKERTKDERVKSGYDQLIEYAPTDARLSWLLKPENVSELYEKALVTRKANSVRRSLHRAVSDLLTRKFGRGKMLGVMADVEVPGEQDERNIEVSKAEIATILACCDAEFRNCVGFALTSGVDRAPMLALRPDSLSDDGILTVNDTKNASRFRRIKIDADAMRFFRLAAAGKKPHERVFNYTKDQMRDRWEAVRKAAKRKDLRWKDLRAVFATYALEGGMTPRELMQHLGHSSMAMTLRYTKKMPGKSDPSVGKAMGLGRDHLKVTKGGRA